MSSEKITRIRWTKPELIKLGMCLDRLKSDPTVRLLDEPELLRAYAQKEALPLERRRDLTLVEAKTAIERIDALRLEQEQAEWSNTPIEIPLDATVLESDSSEHKRLIKIQQEIIKMESRILSRIDERFKLHEEVMENMIRRVLDKLGAPSSKESIAPAIYKPRVAVLYPSEVKWAHDVPKVIVPLRKEGFEVLSYAIDHKHATLMNLSAFDLVISVDGIGEEKAKRRMLNAYNNMPNDGQAPDLRSFTCASRQQIASHIKSLIVGFISENKHLNKIRQAS